MHKIMFVCHGNICRSPMAEFVLRDMVKKKELDGFEIKSSATSREEIGNPPHRGTLQICREKQIEVDDSKRAVQLSKMDYEVYDLFVAMDENNVYNMMRIFGEDPQNKVTMLLDKNVADPWYTGDFNTTYQDVLVGCEQLLRRLL